MSRLDESEPKMQIPENWAAKMACPVCGSRPLGVFHPTGHADRFVCQSCETSFELENNGTRVRFITLPQGVTPWLRGSWVSLDEALSAFASHQNDTLASPPADAQPDAVAESSSQDAKEEPVAIPAEELVSKPAEVPVSEPAEPPVSKPLEAPVVIPVEATVSEPVEEPTPISGETPPSELRVSKPPEPESPSAPGASTIEETSQPEVLPQNGSTVPPFMANVLPANPPVGDAPKPPEVTITIL